MTQPTPSAPPEVLVSEDALHKAEEFIEAEEGAAFVQAKQTKPQATLRQADYPMLVTFENIRACSGTSLFVPLFA